MNLSIFFNIFVNFEVIPKKSDYWFLMVYKIERVITRYKYILSNAVLSEKIKNPFL